MKKHGQLKKNPKMHKKMHGQPTYQGTHETYEKAEVVYEKA
jgi:hypothetical protein